MVEDEGLKSWISEISFGCYSPPCRKTTITMTTELFLKLEDTVFKWVKLYSSDNGGMWVTVDGWTSQANQSYCGIIAHFLSSDFVPMSFVLTMVAINNHDVESISFELKSVLKEWELQNII